MSDPVILVAEDERDIRELVIFTLQLSGFHVVEAANGEEAVDVKTFLYRDTDQFGDVVYLPVPFARSILVEDALAA